MSGPGSRLYTSEGGGGGGDWQLDTGHYEDAVIPLEIIAPVAGIGPENIYGRAYPGMPYVWPVGVLGGAPPFRYEVVAGPTGLTIGEEYGDADYGVIRWTNPTTSGMPGGGWSVTIRVYDQAHGRPSDSYVDVTYDLLVTTSGWLWVDSVNGNPHSSNGGSATGTFADPLETIDDFYISKHDSTFSSYDAIVFRAGEYRLDAAPLESSTRVTFTSAKPTNYMVYPGEVGVLNHENAHFSYEGGDNFTMAGFTHRNVGVGSGAATPWPKGIVWQGAYNDVVIFNNIIEDQSEVHPDENPSLMFAAGSGPDIGERCLISHNDIQGARDKDVLLIYYVNKGVFQWNTLANIERPIYLKQTFRYWSIRWNDGWDGTNSAEAMVRVDPYGTALDVEICYNLYQGEEAGVLAGYEGGTVEIFEYRNTWDVTYQHVINAEGTWTATRNVLRHSATYNATFGWFYEDSSLTASRTDQLRGNSGMIDASGLLTGTDRTNYLGIRGHEHA
jgi:hypothetical protein